MLSGTYLCTELFEICDHFEFLLNLKMLFVCLYLKRRLSRCIFLEKAASSEFGFVQAFF